MVQAETTYWPAAQVVVQACGWTEPPGQCEFAGHATKVAVSVEKNWPAGASDDTHPVEPGLEEVSTAHVAQVEAPAAAANLPASHRVHVMLFPMP